MIPDHLLELVTRAGSVLLTSHANPDGDAIGSELGLARALRRSGRRAEIWNADATPALYRSLPGAESIRVGAEPPPGFPDRFDLCIVLECPTLERSGLGGHLESIALVNIDHHLGNSGYGAASWIDPGAAAVAILVMDLCLAIEAPLDVESASCLLVGLASDTGGFRFGNTTPDAFRAAARLLELGADIEKVTVWLHESRPEASVRLLGALLGSLRRFACGRIATVHMTLEMLRAAGADLGDTEGLVDVPRSIAGVEAVGLLRELGPDEWKVSLRSRGAVDVEQIARRYGGGGHRNAAGFVIAGDLEHAHAEVREALERALEAAA